MAKDDEMLSDEVWKKFLKRHWKMALVVIGGVAGALIVGLLVFLWLIDGAEAAGFPTAIGNWTVGYGFTFFFKVVLWELICVGSWIIPIAVVIFFQWYKKLPDEEREEYEREPKKKWPRRGISAGGGGGLISFLVFLTWLIIVWIDGNWDTAFSSWVFTDWVYSWLAAFLWDLLIIGIPVTIGLVWWLRREIQKEP